MNTTENSDFNFVVGGSLSSDAMCYVERQADQDFYQGLKEGEFCYVFNSRQTGKSSLRNRTERRLKAEGYACAAIDLTTIGTTLSLEQWYATIIMSIATSFELEFQFTPWWRERELLSPVNKLSQFIEKVLLAQVEQNIVIFIDEIDGVLSLDFPTDDFFAFIRSCYNRRAEQPEFNRLTFALLGVAVPSDLIQDVKQTPFNIGRAIELNGFQIEEAQILTRGLENNAENPETVLQQILYWTGGQPFLTQKLCDLVLTHFSPSSPIAFGTEKKQIENLVRSQIIENWEAKDNPQHLKTVHDRLLHNHNEPRIFRLLGLYRKILLQGEIEANDRDEQTELRLSGLVVLKDRKKLIVYNPIYQKIFNQEFIDSELNKLSPQNYAKSLAVWLESNRQNKYLLQGTGLQEAQEWAKSKSLSYEDYHFLNASQERRANKFSKFARYAAGGLITLGVLSLAGGIFFRNRGICPPDQITAEETFLPSCIIAFSSGENRLFREGLRNLDLDSGIEAFKSEDYEKAIIDLSRAVNNSPIDPEPQIYLNNSKARLQAFLTKSTTFQIAVVVPANNSTETAKDILRGIAQAQTEFNKDQKKKSQPLLEIVIANDEDEPKNAKKIAKKIVKHKRIIAVIGHDSSETTQAALQEYKKAGLAVITPTASSTELSGYNFFRIPSSNEIYGTKLAKYAKEKMNLEKVAFFYKSESTYSETFKDAFEAEFGREIVAIDLTDSKDWKKEIELLVSEEKVQAAVLLPSTTTASRAIAIALANAELPEEQRLKLFSAGIIYGDDILRQVRDAFEGLVLVVPWQDETDYTDKAQERWKKNVGWRMAMSFDAIQVVIQSLSEGATRQTVLKKLNDFKTLSADQTSGEELCFDSKGDSNRFARIREVINGNLQEIKGEKDPEAKPCPLNKSQ